MHKEIPDTTLLEIKEYLLEDATVERGCLITKKFEIISFKNIAKFPLARIQMGQEDFGVMADLVMNDNLFGWAHSHPKWSPYPSMTDLNMHPFPMTMVIYSVPEDRFGIYSHEEVETLNRTYSMLSYEDPNWKNKVTQILEQKELINV